MRRRILHTGDLHIGASKTVAGVNYLHRQSSMMDQIAAHAREQQVDAIVVPGDVFDAADVTHDERALFTRKLLLLDSIAPVLMIPGNHDYVQPGMTTLRPYVQMSRDGRFRQSHVVERTTLVQVKDILFLLLVCKEKEFRAHLRSTLRAIRSSSLRPVYKHLVVVLHQTVQGGLGDNGYKLEQGVAWEESLSKGVPVTYFALGDLHSHQRIGKRAFYSGSPVMTKFDPVVVEHGVLLVDLDDPDHPTLLPVRERRFLTVKARDTKRFREAEEEGAVIKAIVPRDATPEEIQRARKAHKHDYEKVDLDLADLRVGDSLEKDVRRALKRRGMSKTDVREAAMPLFRELKPSLLDD